MKKISNILLAVTFALPLFTACETDNDSNPILNEPDTFTLNTPAYAANNVYDLKNAQSVELTCSQPDYGFPAATTYTVQASFEQDFIEATDESKANYTVLESTSPTAKINVDASELNNALLDLWTAVNGEQAELPTEPVAVYIHRRFVGIHRRMEVCGSRYQRRQLRISCHDCKRRSPYVLQDRPRLVEN